MKWVGVACINSNVVAQYMGSWGRRDDYEGDITPLGTSGVICCEQQFAQYPREDEIWGTHKGLATLLEQRWGERVPDVPSANIKELFTVRAVHDLNLSPAHLDSYRCSGTFLLSLSSSSHHPAFSYLARGWRTRLGLSHFLAGWTWESYSGSLHLSPVTGEMETVKSESQRRCEELLRGTSSTRMLSATENFWGGKASYIGLAKSKTQLEVVSSWMELTLDCCCVGWMKSWENVYY